MKVIILANGQSAHKPKLAGAHTTSNWNGYTGRKKHFIELEGEVLIERTVSQFLGKSNVSEVVISNGEDDPAYDLPGTTRYRPDETRRFLGDMDMFYATVPAWEQEGSFFEIPGEIVPVTETLLVYGDVWLSHEAVNTILSHHPVEDWWVYGRAGGSRYTGTPWGEQWAVRIRSAAYPRAIRAMEVVYDAFSQGRIGRAGPWEWYTVMAGMPILRDRVNVGPNWTEIDDWTDDFDFASDYERWVALRKERKTGR
jgi:hypothetical protein